MKKLLIAAAAIATVAGVAAPAAAQWAPQYASGYNNSGYNNGYNQGYNGSYNQGYNRYGNGSALENRIGQIRQDIRHLERRGALSRWEGRSLEMQARNLQLRVRQMAFNGVDPRERFVIDRQISRLEWQVRREANDRNDQYGNRGYGDNAYGNGYTSYDRDHDGRDDRFEDDHGNRHDD